MLAERASDSEIKFSKGIREMRSRVCVVLKENDRGRNVQIKLPNDGAFNDAFLKVPDERARGYGWRMFGIKIKKFSLDG